MFFFKKSKTVEKEEDKKAESVSVKDRKKCTQTSLELTLAYSEVAKAEIRWTFDSDIDSVLKGNSNNQNANISTLFEIMFLECRTAKLFSLGVDRLRYSFNYGLAPYFHQILTEKVQKSEIYNILFDESLNDSNRKCQMDSIVRYWECSEQRVLDTGY